VDRRGGGPFIRQEYPDHLEDFNAVTTTPGGLMLPRVLSRGVGSIRGSSGEYERHQQNARAEAHEAASNPKIAAAARDKIVAFLDGLLQLDVGALGSTEGQVDGDVLKALEAISQIASAAYRQLVQDLGDPDRLCWVGPAAERCVK